MYADYNATTPPDPRVVNAMQPWLTQRYGNASSREYRLAWDAAEAVEDARERVARCINADSGEIVFTASATEALNLAIKGFVGYAGWDRKKLVVCATEHAAILACCSHLHRATGIELEILGVDRDGRIDSDALGAALQSCKKVLLAVMAVNNELGTIQPLAPVAAAARAAGAIFLCDLTQAIGKIPVDVHATDIDMAAFSAHKIYGPKGQGALFIRHVAPALELEPLIVGGGQERGLRGGTHDVAGIVGFGEACAIAVQESPAEAVRLAALRDRFERSLHAALPQIWINGAGSVRVANTTSIGFGSIDARHLLRDVDEIDAATRSACASGRDEPSHVLKAIGLDERQSGACIRFSFGRFTTDAEIDFAIEKIIQSARRLGHPGRVSG
jgi:cysteine desulfurase